MISSGGALLPRTAPATFTKDNLCDHGRSALRVKVDLFESDDNKAGWR